MTFGPNQRWLGPYSFMLGYLLSQSLRNASNIRGVAATAAAETHMHVADGLRPVEAKMDGLELAVAAMWELMREKFDLTDDQLVAKITEIDARDGAVDGKLKPKPAAEETCPSCHKHVLSRTGTTCLWCGAPLARSTVPGTR